jgi:NAD(P)-dependent dehydrogenase (short-subunit alcohol dehydrogenase family)
MSLPNEKGKHRGPDGSEGGPLEFLPFRTALESRPRMEELAGAAVFLASDAASFVNGDVLIVNGGFLASCANQ